MILEALEAEIRKRAEDHVSGRNIWPRCGAPTYCPRCCDGRPNSMLAEDRVRYFIQQEVAEIMRAIFKLLDEGAFSREDFHNATRDHSDD